MATKNSHKKLTRFGPQDLDAAKKQEHWQHILEPYESQRLEQNR